VDLVEQPIGAITLIRFDLIIALHEVNLSRPTSTTGVPVVLKV
jgi:hypothetical protein